MLVEKASKEKKKQRQVTGHAPQVYFDASYVLKRDNCGNVVAKYVGYCNKKNA